MGLHAFKTSDWIKIGGGALFFVAGFLTWWKVEFAGGLFGVGANWSGLGDYFGTVGVAWLVFTAIAVLTALTALGMVSLPQSVPAPLLYLAASVLGALLVLVRFVSDGVSIHDLGAAGVEISRGAGAWLGLIAAIVIVAGCVIAFTESGGKLSDLKDIDKLKSELGAMTHGGTPTPPAPPA